MARNILDIEINTLVFKQGDYNITCSVITSYVPGVPGSEDITVNRIIVPALLGILRG